MANLSRKHLVELLKTMLRHIPEPDALRKHKFTLERLFSGDDSWMRIQAEGMPPIEMRADPSANLGPAFYLVDGGCVAFESYIREAFKDEAIGNHVGTKALEKAIEGLLRKFKSTPNVDDQELDSAVRESLKFLRASIRSWEAFVPVDNLLLEGLAELRVGRVYFRPYTSVDKLLREAVFHVVEVSPNPEEEKPKFKELIESNLLALYAMAPSCAQLTLKGEESRIPELVDADVDAALNLLRCFTNLLFDRGQRAFIGLRGTVFGADRPCFILAPEEERFIANVQKTGMLFPFRLNAEKLQFLKEHCAFDILTEVLAKPDSSRTELEKVLLTAIRWLGRGVVAADYPEKVLTLSVAMERLLTTDKEEHADITDRLARRLALLVSTDTNSRLEIYRRAKQLYGLRSEVVHAGRTDIEDFDVIQMEQLAVSALIKLGEHSGEWQRHEDFTCWAEKLAFASTIP